MKRAFVFILAASLTACSVIGNGKSAQVKVERNVLTDLQGSNGKVIAVKFDDTTYSHPQAGVEKADVVYVTQVEAGLTRLMGIYTSNYQIGRAHV